MQRSGNEGHSGPGAQSPTSNGAPGPPDTRIYPLAPSPSDEAESLDVWGFADTEFRFNRRGRIEVTGDRYPGLSGEELPHLLPWFNQVIGVELDPADLLDSGYLPEVPLATPAPAFLEAVGAHLSEDQVSTDPALRVRHGHGHTLEEMFNVKYGRLPRVPDYVVFPESEAQVVALVEAAQAHGASLIPYGGGTNVTNALQPPPGEERAVVSVDMRRMNRILWIDPVNRMACIQAGAVGRHIMRQLADYGLTIGHEPDSVEFSTLGGWIATNASGMKKNRYGNIEDVVLDVTVVGAQGVVKREGALPAPRESVGMDPTGWLFGSEGTLGVITSAVVRLFPLPPVQRYGSVLFHDLERGVRFLYDLSETGKVPASVRVVDNMQFQFGQALKPAKGALGAIKSRAEKLLVTGPLKFDPTRMVACTLVFEGTEEEVAEQERVVYRLAKRHNGFKAGAENGRRGYKLTFGIAYIRDFILRHHVVAESFETSVPWSQALVLCENVKRRIERSHAERGLPGKPFVSCRITQVYPTGVCVYFYLAFYAKGVEDPVEVFHDIEREAREAVLASGGSLSHHHGVGKLRQPFIPEIMSPAAVDWRTLAKQALDPQDVFGCGNLAPPRQGVAGGDLGHAASGS
jgi:alkyldihydroxyacetonephosphate synthase